MIPEDFEQIQKYFPIWKDNCNFREICLISPNEDQYTLVKKLFPASNVVASTVRNWNLNQKSKKKYDLICAMNVFNYSKRPTLWFDNVLNSSRYLWLQDLVNRHRSEKGVPFQLGNDGDSMRYCFLPNVTSTFENAFDLSVFKQKIIDFRVYATKGKPGIENLHFICNMKGNLEFDDIGPSNKGSALLSSLCTSLIFKLKRMVKPTTN